MSNNMLITTSSFGIKDLPAEYNFILNPYKRKLTEDEIIGLMQEYKPVGMIAGVEPLTEKVMETAPQLKVISRCGVGVDSVDMDAAKKLGKIVEITPDAPMVAVSELTIGMLMSLLRKIPTLDAGVKSKQWLRPLGNLLRGKTVGIIGCGRIGTYVANILKAFGCELVGYDPYITEHSLCKMMPLADLIAQSDIVTMHIPYTKENHHMIDAGAINAMKDGAILVNISRGNLVDEDALYTALKSGKLSGAAFDCFAQEPYEGPLTELENVVLSPHMGSSAVEARSMMEQQALDNLMKHFA